MTIQLVHLLYRNKHKFDSDSVVERAEEILSSGIEVPQETNHGTELHIFHSDAAVRYEDGVMPAQTVITSGNKKSSVDDFSDEIQQSWGLNDAAERIERCTYSLLVSEFMATGLEPSERVRLFHGVLQSLVEVSDPEVIVFNHSMQVVPSTEYLDSCELSPIQRPGSLNVRFFRVSNSNEQDMIMDLRGLDEIGLHDLQCHYRDLDPRDVSTILFNLAFYIFEKGKVIESGHTIPGIDPDSKWKCQFEESILEPNRMILDLNPGFPFAAGNRE